MNTGNLEIQVRGAVCLPAPSPQTLSSTCGFAKCLRPLPQGEGLRAAAFTLAEQAEPAPKTFGSTRFAFTLAEVLITLGIIGVVASLTMPALISKTEKQVTISRLKKAYTVINQSIKLAEADNGSFAYWEKKADINIDTYFEKYWKPYFRGIELCAAAKDCGYKDVKNPWTMPDGSTLSNWNVVTSESRMLFKIIDGMVVFFPRNTVDAESNPVYVNYFYVDINGPQKPNVLGRDVFTLTITDDKGVAMLGYNRTIDFINDNCKLSDGTYCGAKIMYDGWEIKDDYPVKF